MCVLSIKVPIRKKSGNLFNDPHNFDLINSFRNFSIISAGINDQISYIAFCKTIDSLRVTVLENPPHGRDSHPGDTIIYSVTFWYVTQKNQQSTSLIRNKFVFLRFSKPFSHKSIDFILISLQGYMSFKYVNQICHSNVKRKQCWICIFIFYKVKLSLFLNCLHIQTLKEIE